MLRLWAHFSYVIVDTAPANTITDASNLAAAAANGTTVVVEQGCATFHSINMLSKCWTESARTPLGQS